MLHRLTWHLHLAAAIVKLSKYLWKNLLFNAGFVSFRIGIKCHNLHYATGRESSVTIV